MKLGGGTLLLRRQRVGFLPRNGQVCAVVKLPLVLTVTGENLAAASDRLRQLRRKEMLSEEDFAARKQEILFSLAAASSPKVRMTSLPPHAIS